MPPYLVAKIERLMADTGMTRSEACSFYGRRGNRSPIRKLNQLRKKLTIATITVWKPAPCLKVTQLQFSW